MESAARPTSLSRMFNCLAKFISIGVLAIATWPSAMHVAAIVLWFFSTQLPNPTLCPLATSETATRTSLSLSATSGPAKIKGRSTADSMASAVFLASAAPVLPSSGWALARRTYSRSAPYSAAFLAHFAGSFNASPQADTNIDDQSLGSTSLISMAIAGRWGCAPSNLTNGRLLEPPTVTLFRPPLPSLSSLIFPAHFSTGASTGAINTSFLQPPGQARPRGRQHCRTALIAAEASPVQDGPWTGGTPAVHQGRLLSSRPPPCP